MIVGFQHPVARCLYASVLLLLATWTLKHLAQVECTKLCFFKLEIVDLGIMKRALFELGQHE